jgi:DNA-binding transcriptional ArsR family regulator
MNKKGAALPENSQFTSGDISRLMNLVHSVANRSHCSVSEAIDYVERAVDSVQRGPKGRSVAEYADGIRRLRVRRNEVLGLNIFRDPAWDMLLDLLVAHDKKKDVSVGSVCVASGVPPTTALRHVEILERAGVVDRRGDLRDQRRMLLSLKDNIVPPLTDLVSRLQACA